MPREPRPVSIREFVLEAYDPVTPVFRVRCSKGTYIRTLIEDLARHLGTLAHVIALRRLAVEPFGGQAMVSLPEIEALAAAAALTGPRRPWTACCGRCRTPCRPGRPCDLDGPAALRVSRGGPVPAPAGQTPGPVRLYGPGDSFLGVGEVGADGIVEPPTPGGPGSAGDSRGMGCRTVTVADTWLE